MSVLPLQAIVKFKHSEPRITIGVTYRFICVSICLLRGSFAYHKEKLATMDSGERLKLENFLDLKITRYATQSAHTVALSHRLDTFFTCCKWHDIQGYHRHRSLAQAIHTVRRMRNSSQPLLGLRLTVLHYIEYVLETPVRNAFRHVLSSRFEY